MQENYYALLICILRPDFTIDRSLTYMLCGRLHKRMPCKHSTHDMILMKSRGMTNKEISEMLGIKQGTIQKRIRRYLDREVIAT